MKTTKLCLFAAAVASVVLLAGCSTPATRIAQNPEAFARLSPQDQALVRAGQVGIGMDMETVRIALGNPDRISVRTNASGQTFIWHYQETVFYDGAYLYPGPYWQGGRRHWGGYWGGYWGPGPWDFPAPAALYDRFRIEFKNGKVSTFNQEF